MYGYQHDRFWCMDMFKEQQELTDLYNSRHAPLGGLEGRRGRGPSSRVLPIKECFEQLKREVEPDVVVTHHREDRHQDHRLVSELATTPSATTSSSNPRS